MCRAITIYTIRQTNKNKKIPWWQQYKIITDSNNNNIIINNDKSVVCDASDLSHKLECVCVVYWRNESERVCATG